MLYCMNTLQLMRVRELAVELLAEVDKVLQTPDRQLRERHKAHNFVRALPSEKYRARDLQILAQAARIPWREAMVPVLRTWGWTATRDSRGVIWSPPQLSAPSSGPTQQP